MGKADPLTDLPRVRSWQRHTRSPLRVHTLPGGHFFTHTVEVAEILRHLLTTGPKT